MGNLQQLAHRSWQTVWHTLPGGVRHFLEPYHRRMFSNRLIVVFWPTFRCNYSCSYCPVHTKFDFATVYPKACEKTWQQWDDALSKLPPAAIYIAGGEPFLYPGLADLINNLPTKHRLLGIVTNLSMPVAVFQKIRHSTLLNASFHREFVSSDAFVAKVKELREFFHLEVNVVATPENLPVIAAIDEQMKAGNIGLHIDPYVDTGFRYTEEEAALLKKYSQRDRKDLPDFEDFSLKSCSAGRNYINLMPNGEVFSCAGGYSYTHSPLFAHIVAGHSLGAYKMGSVFDPAFSPNPTDMLCELPCHAYCDRDAVLVKLAQPARRQGVTL